VTFQPERAPTVLVVDDDDRFRATLVRMLAGAGYECAEAATAEHARAQLARADGFAVLLCDVRMPGESGIELVRDVTAELPELAVVMVTGSDDPETARLAFDSGAYGYLVKPFTPNELLVSLAGALSRRDLEAQRQRHVQSLERTVERMRRLTGALGEIGDAATPADDEETVDRLSRAVSLRDEETGAHIERMSRYAAHLAAAAGILDVDARHVRLAAAMHDVGKIGVADTILLKPGPLTPVEYAAMQRHAQLGYQLLAGAASALLRQAADVAYAHHEWWDGGGYPRGLRADAIPPAARVAAVADVFDALTSDRVYRPAYPVDEAVAMRSDLRGRQFEPRVFDAFVAAVDDLVAIRGEFPDTADEPRIRVLVVDDHEIFVESLVRLLGGASAIKVVGQAASVTTAVAAAVAYEPDVVLMDFELPDGTGIDAARRIKSLVPRTKVVMLTGRTDDLAYLQALDAGCAGFVTKQQPADALINAISLAHHDESTISAAELRPLLRRLPKTRRGVGSALGRREIEVLGLVADGLTNKAVAQRLSLSVNTVRNHMQSILYKLHAHSKLEAVATAVKEGVIDYSRGGSAS
jgi:putative two-component system response regulator